MHRAHRPAKLMEVQGDGAGEGARRRGDGADDGSRTRDLDLQWGAISARSFVAVIAVLAFLGRLTKGADTLELGDQAPDLSMPVLGEEREASLADFEGELGPRQLLGPVVRAVS